MSDKSSFKGMVYKIIAGVATAVLTAAATSYFGIGKNDSSKPAGVSQEQYENLLAKLDNMAQDKVDNYSEKQNKLSNQVNQISDQQKTNFQNTVQNQMQLDPANTFREIQPVSDQTQANYTFSGYWVDNNSGATYTLQQTGTNVSVLEYSVGVNTAAGQGQIFGNEADITFSTIYGFTGTATMVLSYDGSLITMTVYDPISQLFTISYLYRM